MPPDLATRAARHAALGDPVRLAMVDELRRSDRSPAELARAHDLGTNLLAHHLDVLERAGLVERSRSSGDGRRRYVHLRPEALTELVPDAPMCPAPALFVCTANSARSQLAAALWRERTGAPGLSAGTHPAARVHRGAVAAARRAGLDLRRAVPAALPAPRQRPALVVTVCDRAHEELGPDPDRLHWSVPDPVPAASRAAFDATIAELDRRIAALTGARPA